MSENLDLVRSIYADLERGEFFSRGWQIPRSKWCSPTGRNP